MRHLNHLPIWRDANRLLLAIEQAVRVFPRYHKYTLGSELRRQAMQVCRLIMRAADQRAEQARWLAQLVMAIDDLKLSVQLAKELDAFRNFKEFQTVAELAVAVGKQSGGWRFFLMPNTCGSCAAESDAPGVFTYSNRVGKGNHAAVARLARFMRALRDWQGAIARFLAERLQLELKAEPGPRPVTDGADFLGYIVRPDYVLVRRRVVGNLRLKLAGFARAYVTATSLRLPPAGRERLRAILASYLGHFAHADAWRLSQSLFAPPAWPMPLSPRKVICAAG